MFIFTIDNQNVGKKNVHNSELSFEKILLQKSPETFLEAVRSYLGFVEGAPTSGLYNTPTLMTTRLLNHFLLK